METFNFKKFKAVNQRSIDKISITASNTFNFPSKFFYDNKLDRYEYVVLYHDQGKAAIGFNFTSDEDEKYKFKLQKSKKGYGGFISATSFFKVNNIDSKVYKGRYDWRKEAVPEVGTLFVIELNEGQKRPASENQSSN